MTDKPEAILTRLLLSMFSADELRRLLRFNFPQDLALSLPGATAPPIAVAEAAAEALINRGLLDTLWPALIEERPRRRDEILVAQRAIESRSKPVVFPQSERSPKSVAASHLEVPRTKNRPRPSRPPIRILFVLSCPRTQEQLATEEEIRAIRDELRAAQYRDRFTHEVVPAATFDHLRKALRQHNPHILHIACHGTAEGELILDDGHGGEERIEAETFVDLLDVLKNDLRLVVFNACHSTAVAHKVAPLVNLVIGMRGAVPDSSAIAFSKVFYESIAAGDTVETGFRLGLIELKRRRTSIAHPELLPLDGAQRQFRFARS